MKLPLSFFALIRKNKKNFKLTGKFYLDDTPLIVGYFQGISHSGLSQAKKKKKKRFGKEHFDYYEISR